MNVPDDADVVGRARFAAGIAAAAGLRVLALRARARWPDPGVLGDVADQAADGYLQGALRSRYERDGVLSEETADAPERLRREWTWIVDPLDGTKEFVQGRPDFAVHVGLVRAGVAVAGVVALPAVGRLFVAPADGAGVALLGGDGDWPTTIVRGDSEPPARLRIAVSRTHTTRLVHELARQLGDVELVPGGSVGFKVGMLLSGRADLYLHERGLHEWDTCAPEAVARAAGWSVSRLDGEPHRYNRPDPRNHELLVCRPSHRARVLELLAPLR